MISIRTVLYNSHYANLAVNGALIDSFNNYTGGYVITYLSALIKSGDTAKYTTNETVDEMSARFYPSL